MRCDCCKETVHRVDGDELCFGCSIIQDFVAIIGAKTDISGDAAVGVACKLVELLRSRILELGRDVGSRVDVPRQGVRPGDEPDSVTNRDRRRLRARSPRRQVYARKCCQRHRRHHQYDKHRYDMPVAWASRAEW